MANFWLAIILSSALLVYSDQGVEHLKQLHCKLKPGCTLAKCNSMPDRWSLIGGLNPPSHEYSILCQNDEDSSCCGKHLTTMEQNAEEMKSGFKTLELRLEMMEKREAEAKQEMKSEYKRNLLKLELRLEMTERREAKARLAIDILENEKSAIKKEVENLKKESTAIKRAADENRNEIALLQREQSEMKEQAKKLKNETRAIRRTANGNKEDLESRIQENVEKIVNRVLDKSSAKMEEIRNETRRVIEEYRREENGIDGKIEEFERTVNGKLEEINVKIEKMQNKSEEGISENRTDQGEMTSRSTSGSSKTTESPHQATTSTKTRTESTTTSIGVPCTNGMMYENNCFIPVVDVRVNYDDGVAKCESLGGQLANIYSQTHMDDVMKYIRDNRLGDRDFRLGMKYDPKAKKFTLRDGTDALAGLKWLLGNPGTVEDHGERFAGWTNVILAVSSDQSSTWNYLFNNPPSRTSYVLCGTE